VRGAIQQHLEAEGRSGTGLLTRDEIEGHATEAYRRARLAHALAYELPTPHALARRLSILVRTAQPPGGVMAARVGDAIVVAPMSRADRRELCGALFHEICHDLLKRTRHTHEDVIHLTLALVAPWETLRACAAAGELSAKALSTHYQPHAPLWLLQWRVGVAAELFGTVEVA